MVLCRESVEMWVGITQELEKARPSSLDLVFRPERSSRAVVQCDVFLGFLVSGYATVGISAAFEQIEKPWLALFS
jgi:hypothetical protein